MQDNREQIDHVGNSYRGGSGPHEDVLIKRDMLRENIDTAVRSGTDNTAKEGNFAIATAEDCHQS